MLSELMQRIRDVFKPYTLEDYIRDANPQNWSELKELERNWYKYHNDYSKMY